LYEIYIQFIKDLISRKRHATQEYFLKKNNNNKTMQYPLKAMHYGKCAYLGAGFLKMLNSSIIMQWKLCERYFISYFVRHVVYYKWEYGNFMVVFPYKRLKVHRGYSSMYSDIVKYSLHVFTSITWCAMLWPKPHMI